MMCHLPMKKKISPEGFGGEDEARPLAERPDGVDVLQAGGEHEHRAARRADHLPLGPVQEGELPARRGENHQTLESSFSSAWKPIFAPKYAFFSIFRGLQDLQSFAPLQFQNLSKMS